jgi:hypothetical protein
MRGSSTSTMAALATAMLATIYGSGACVDLDGFDILPISSFLEKKVAASLKKAYAATWNTSLASRRWSRQTKAMVALTLVIGDDD